MDALYRHLGPRALNRLTYLLTVEQARALTSLAPSALAAFGRCARGWSQWTPILRWSSQRASFTS